MQLLRTPNKHPNLITQIQLLKNYNEHRKRLGITRYKSPLSLKKSLSFDQEKSILFNQLKTRKTYTNDFLKKQKTRLQEESDAIMLKKILEYDRKMFAFSLNPQTLSSNNPSLLHHNSRVAQSKTNNKIDSENEKIHFRITKAKSQYGREQLKTFRQTPSAMTFLMKRQHSENKFNQRNASVKKIYTEAQAQNYEESLTINKIPQLTEAKKIRDQVLRVQTAKSRLSYRPNSTAIATGNAGKLFTLFGNSVCDRIRKERLANKLYERKLRFQNTVGSTFHRKKER